MSWNNGYERRKFENLQRRLSEKYRKVGMSEEQIQALYEFDLRIHKSERINALHTQPLDEKFFHEDGNDESDNPLLKHNIDDLSVDDETSEFHSRYWWIEQIENSMLTTRIKKLSGDDLELLTQYVFDGLNQSELSRFYGISQKNICKKLKRIVNILKTGV